MAEHYHVGWDYFSPDPGTKEKMYCRVCKSEMTAKRNVMGPTSSIGAMVRSHHLHDSFYCPQAQEKWHNQARKLMEKIETEDSKYITEILQKEVDEILETKKPTK